MMKDQFIIPGGQIYLLTHSIGLMPKSAQHYTQEQFFEIWRSNPADAWPEWLAIIAEFKRALAELFNSDAANFCPQNNISSGLTKVIQSFPERRKRNIILLNENDFPSIGFVLKKMESMGFKTRIIPKSEDPQDIDTWKIAFTEDVYCTLITHSHYNTSRLIPVEKISRIARERGIISIVDIAQSGGIVPIDFQRWRADIIIGSCVKWLCGGPGAGFLWVDSNLIQQLEPIDVGWFSHKNPLEFNIHNFDYADDSSRFWGGTPSVMPFALATNSIRQLIAIGVANIRAHNRLLTGRVIEAVGPDNVVSPSEPASRGGTLVLKFAEQEKTEKALMAANLKFDSRREGMRISPHIYTTEEEIEQVINLLSPPGSP